ncbi:hypothetical protein T439DRAFT_360193 [Meredithblackwellia eburnea MCA 4105]
MATTLAPSPSMHNHMRSPASHHPVSASPVRLPPVSLPPEGFLQPVTFNPHRRVSITDPFLHAYPPPMDSSQPAGGSSSNPDSYMSNTSSSAIPQHPQQQHRRTSDGQDSQPPNSANTNNPSSNTSSSETNSSRPGSAIGGAATAGLKRYSGAGPSSGYEFGSSFAGATGASAGAGGTAGQQATTSGPGAGGAGPGSSHPHQGVPAPFQAHANRDYRFGGPSGGGMAPSVADAGPSYFDYSMRRHSLTNAGGPPGSAGGAVGGPQPSPPRLPSIDSTNTQSPGGGGLKRKTSVEDTIAEEAYSYGPGGYPSHLGSGTGGAPYAKRRGSGMTYDKMGNLSLGGPDSRRDSMISSGGMSAWDDERRGSGASYGSQGSQGGYPSSYSVQSPVDPYDSRGMGSYGQPPPPQSSLPHHLHRHHSLDQGLSSGYEHHQHHQMQHHHQGHRPSVSMGGQHHQMDDMAYGHNRRQSMPTPNNQGQVSQVYNGVGGYGGPPGRAMSQPSVMVHASEDGPTASGLPSAPSGWGRGGPIQGAPPPHPIPSRNNSTSSLDPSAAYGKGDIGNSPYSRSPELRVSHKLAERKRRKEMAQLFEELRDALPVDRGLKSSKWEILSKAVDYIQSLKDHNNELQRDNAMLRDHFGLPPGPQQAVAASHMSQSPPDGGYGNPPPSSSHGVPPPQGTHQPPPPQSHVSPHHDPMAMSPRSMPPPEQPVLGQSGESWSSHPSPRSVPGAEHHHFAPPPPPPQHVTSPRDQDGRHGSHGPMKEERED